jgi:quercetin dioxygenase-like cupin family protein
MGPVHAALQEFIDRLAPMLPTDFAQAVAGLDLGRLRGDRTDPANLPVCRFWPGIRAGGGALIECLARLSPYLHWVQNPNYVAQPPSPDFLDNYGYAVLAGPGGLVATDSLALGILLLGPGTHYPTHRHPAVEVYVVAAGVGEWRKAEEPWQKKPAGSVIRHETMVPHATRALGEPLLAVYLWRGDLKTHARIIGS